MPKHCIVKGCKSQKENGFPFPLDRPEAVKKWIVALEKHQKISDDYETKLVCPDHFTENDYLKSRGKTNCLNKKAIPSIFPTIDEGEASEDEEEIECPKPVIKSEPEVDDVDRSHGRNLRRRTKIPFFEADSDEDMDDSDFDPGEESDEELSADAANQHDREDQSKGESRSNIRKKSFENNTEGTKVEESYTFLDNDDAIDSDYEPVMENSFEDLQEKIQRKTEVLVRDKLTLKSMEEMIKNQATTIKKLEEELEEILRGDMEENQIDKPENTKDSTSSKADNGKADAAPSAKSIDYNNLDLQIFSISLFYFSPKVYAYLRSIMPYLPPKNLVVDWVKSGHAFTLFPPGVLVKDNFLIDE